MVREIGMLPAFLWLLGAALAGAWLIRTAGAGFLPELMQATVDGRDSFSVLWRLGRRFLAGVLLIFPGPITDVLALLLLLTAGLPRAAGPMPAAGRPAGGAGPSPRSPHRGGSEVIEGEFRRED